MVTGVGVVLLVDGRRWRNKMQRNSTVVARIAGRADLATIDALSDTTKAYLGAADARSILQCRAVSVTLLRRLPQIYV